VEVVLEEKRSAKEGFWKFLELEDIKGKDHNLLVGFVPYRLV